MANTKLTNLVVVAAVAVPLLVTREARAQTNPAEVSASATPSKPRARSRACSDAAVAGRVAGEVLLGAGAEALLGLGGIIVGAAIGNHASTRESGEFFGHGTVPGAMIGGTLLGSAGASLGVLGMNRIFEARADVGWTFAGGFIGGFAGLLPWLATGHPNDAKTIVIVPWMVLPLVGAVVGAEVSGANAKSPRSERSTHDGVELRFASVSPTYDRRGASLQLGGTF